MIEADLESEVVELELVLYDDTTDSPSLAAQYLEVSEELKDFLIELGFEPRS